MSIYAGSRFEGVSTLRDGEGNPYFGRVTPPTMDTEYVEYFTTEGDRIESLAAEYLGDPTRWWEIADINPEIGVFEGLPANTRLRIPRARQR